MSLKLKKTFARPEWGKVTIAGFGPGNPDLLTVKALRALEAADVVFYDDLLDASYLDQFAAEKVYVGKRSTRHAFRQEAINQQLWEAATSGKQVVRLKGGDPFIFGRGMEEYRYLNERSVEVELVPGISSALAAAADALVPLTERGVSSSVAFISGHDLDKLQIPKAETLVIYMGASNQVPLAQRLIDEGWAPATPVAVTRNASYADAETRRYTLERLLSGENLLPSPAIIMVGWTAAADGSRPGRRYLYTGHRRPSAVPEGLHPVHAPLETVDPRGMLQQHPRPMHFNLEDFEGVYFYSALAVEHFMALYGGFPEHLDYRFESAEAALCFAQWTARNRVQTGTGH